MSRIDSYGRRRIVRTLSRASNRTANARVETLPKPDSKRAFWPHLRLNGAYILPPEPRPGGPQVRTAFRFDLRARLLAGRLPWLAFLIL